MVSHLAKLALNTQDGSLPGTTFAVRTCKIDNGINLNEWHESPP